MKSWPCLSEFCPVSKKKNQKPNLPQLIRLVLKKLKKRRLLSLILWNLTRASLRRLSPDSSYITRKSTKEKKFQRLNSWSVWTWRTISWSNMWTRGICVALTSKNTKFTASTLFYSCLSRASAFRLHWPHSVQTRLSKKMELKMKLRRTTTARTIGGSWSIDRKNLISST